MPSAEALVETDRAARYVEQLCSHLGAMRHMGHRSPIRHGSASVPRVDGVERDDKHAVIRFADGSCRLEARDDGLALHVEARDPGTLERLKGGIAARVAKIGRRDHLSVSWS